MTKLTGILIMDYQKIYNQIINRARRNRQRNMGIYYERHHVIPRCMGGKHGEVVLLTGREHYICHLLLCEIYPENIKLKHARWIMVNIKEIDITYLQEYMSD